MRTGTTNSRRHHLWLLCGAVLVWACLAGCEESDSDSEALADQAEVKPAASGERERERENSTENGVVEFKTLSRETEFEEPFKAVLLNMVDVGLLYRRNTLHPEPRVTPSWRDVPFDRAMVIYVSRGRGNEFTGIEIMSVERKDAYLDVLVKEYGAIGDCEPTMTVYAGHVIQLPRSDLPVRFRYLFVDYACR